MGGARGGGLRTPVGLAVADVADGSSAPGDPMTPMAPMAPGAPIGRLASATPVAPAVPAAPIVTAGLSVAAIAIALGVVPALDAPFVEPKLAVLLVAGALGFGCHLLIASAGWRRTRWPRSLTVAASALLLTTGVAALAARLRGPPGAPYAAAEILRLAAVLGVALGAAQAGTGGHQYGSREGSRGGAHDGSHDGWRRRLSEAIHAGAALVAVIGLLQHFRILPFTIPSISVPGSTFGNRNIAAEAVAAAIPFGLGLLGFGAPDLEERPARPPDPLAWLPTLALALELGYLAVARTRGAWLGGAAGIVVFFAMRRPMVSRAMGAVAIAIGMAVVLAAVVPGRWTAHDARDAKRFAPGVDVLREAVDPSSPVARTRIGLWRRTLALYAEHPLWGVGPGNFGVVFPRYAEPGATADGVLSPTAVPRRAHDDLLERLAETGPLGLGALLAVYLAAASIAIRRTRRARRDGWPGDGNIAAASAGSLAAIAVSGLTGFPLAMPATGFLFGVALGFLASEAGEKEPAENDTRQSQARDDSRRLSRRAAGARVAGAWMLAVLALGGAGWWSARRLAASYFLARAEAFLRADDGAGQAARALPLLSRAARLQPGNFKVALRTATAAARAGRAAESAEAAGRALAIEPDSANAWEALARARLQAGDSGAADVAAARALAILHDYPGALQTRALAAARRGDVAGVAEARARLIALGATNPEARHLAAELALPPPAAR